jgi:GT2 family glycosyltransferase
MTKISIVIPSANSDANLILLKKCLSSLIRHKSPGYEYEVIVVGNPMDGFSLNVNRGLRQASANWILIMNDDVEVLGPWEDIMLAPFQDPTVGIVGDYRTAQHSFRYSAMFFTMIKTELFDKIGYLDEDLAIFSQDIAFGHLAKQAGFRTEFVQVPLLHKYSQTVQRLPDQNAEKENAKKIFKQKYNLDHDSA